MSRGWIVYILMFGVLGVGLWAVLRFGAKLHAPEEIAGTWKVRWETTNPSGGPAEGTLAVDQSGRFCTFHFDEHRRTISMKMIDGSAAIAWASDTIKVALTTVTYSPAQDTDDFFNDVTNEVTGTGYTAGGATLGTKSSTYDTATDTIRLDLWDDNLEPA